MLEIKKNDISNNMILEESEDRKRKRMGEDD